MDVIVLSGLPRAGPGAERGRVVLTTLIMVVCVI